MLICPKCGKENGLGRVFCSDCGAKLDTDGLTTASLRRGWSPLSLLQYWKKVVAALVAVALVLGGLALWPRAPVIGGKGTRMGGRRVETQLEALSQARDGRAMTAQFAEKDVNGYLEFLKIPNMRVAALSLCVKPGYFEVRMLRMLKPIGVGSFRLVPRLTYDLACVPVGGAVVVRKASLGHLPLWGGARAMAVRAVHRVVSAEREWAYLRSATAIEVGDESVSVRVGR
jgi:hypothetical protein